jgi:hypothetical protein
MTMAGTSARKITCARPTAARTDSRRKRLTGSARDGRAVRRDAGQHLKQLLYRDGLRDSASSSASLVRMPLESAFTVRRAGS